MEFDLLFNFMPIFSTILFVIVTIITVFQKLKLRWPVKVNCWFCNDNSKICRQQLNWWLCPHCEQYNGFSKNGDYAYSIPEQYKISSNNSKRYCSVGQDVEVEKLSTSSLCNHCITNETLKISRLSNYIPINDKNYEQEVKQFKESLEQEYPLCVNCKNTVYNVLYKQALWLAKYKMLLFKQKPFCLIANNTKYSESIFRIISTILDSIVAYNMDSVLLPIGGLFFQFCACCVASARRRSSDILLMFLWICIIILLPFKDSKIMKTDLQNKWFSFEYITQYHMIMLFTSIIGFINIKPGTYKSTINKNMTLKKMESFSKNTMLSDSCITTSNNKHNFDTKIINDVGETVTNVFTPNLTNECMPFCTDRSSSKPTLFQNSFTNQESQLSTTPIIDNSILYNSPSIHNNSMVENYSLNDSLSTLSTLSTLSLSEDKPKYTNKTPNIFKKKVYSTRGSELFKKLNGVSSKKNILAPPKLKSVTQASWVAGGYWQDGIVPPTLSRSSSQSSGFGSVGSNFAPSREPSIHEFDQCSIMSDTTQSCHVQRQNNISPIGTFYQQSLQFPLSEFKSSVNNQTLKFTLPNLYTPQKLLVSQTGQKNGSLFMDQYLQAKNTNVSDIKNSSKMQMFPSHTTIVTSPVWLSALLCGSLILNIIVLCTTLLR
ncbi:PREDICTED: uncharacterized protein LOC107191099 [Dufourea novaeangliae]|uniref:uncharacterized protein LOC107191099 n=1 Tax=Dufourea novaeangliae TaxID=178035 RepID=UPI000767B9E9|nr:PREDICTED: uncharacterized protein LOC107191099 [Dufourea novaeangliae]